ncbi:dihydrofolate reductase [Alphaproteobacteria bacterium LSUCC0684]
MGAKYPLVAVVAMARNSVIGDGEKLLWHLPGDLPRVKALTMGKPLIMGRRTYQSIGRPLPGRANIVLTRSPDFNPEGVIPVHDAEAALKAAAEWIGEDASRGQEIIIFGGGDIYCTFLAQTSRIELTEVDLSPEGAARFPEIISSDWRETSRETIPAEGDLPSYAYVTLERLHPEPYR